MLPYLFKRLLLLIPTLLGILALTFLIIQFRARRAGGTAGWRNISGSGAARKRHRAAAARQAARA